jgi:hypothetical protein
VTDTMTKQLPFAISQALNKTAFDMRDAMNGATRQYFKNPVPFTQRAFLVNKSNKRDLTAKVYAERPPCSIPAHADQWWCAWAESQ